MPFVVGLVALVILGGCSASSTPPATGSPSASVSSADCVVDPAAVVRAKLPKTADDALPASLTSTLDAAAREAFAKASTPGAVVGVRTPNGTWTGTYGTSDPTSGTPMNADMYQRIGSVTKTFTGTIIAQLADSKKLSLDDPIGKYVSGVPNGSSVTIRMLADMRSGVPSYTTDEGWLKTFFAQPHKVWKPEELLKIGIAGNSLFAPGTKFNYSNTNTILLGKVIEKVTGNSFEHELQTRILTPLGLDQTSFPGGTPDFPQPHAQGFTLQGNDATPDHPANATDWNPSFGWTAGAMISTMKDLLNYGRALGTGQGLLSQQAQVERLRSFIPAKSGYGLALGCNAGWVGHSGELPGYNTTVFYQTATDTTVVVLSNSDIPSGACAGKKPTLTDNPTDEICRDPSVRIFAAVSTALGHTFTPSGG